MCLCSKQSCLFSFYVLPSGGKSKGAVVHVKFNARIKEKGLYKFFANRNLDLVSPGECDN